MSLRRVDDAGVSRAVISARALVAAALAAAAAFGCRTSHLAERGDAAMARGDHGRALANYLAALDRSDTPDREAVAVKRDEAARRYARDFLEHLDRSDRETARGSLVALLTGYNVWGDEPERAAITAALAELIAADLPALESLAAAGHHARAIDRAEALVVPLGPHPLRDRVVQLRLAAATEHLSLAETAPAGAKYFHLRMAAYLGGGVPPELPEAERAARALADPPEESAGRAKPQCAWFAALVAERLRAAGQTAGGEYTIDHCTTDEKRWVTQETHTYQRPEPYLQKVREPYYVWEARDPSCGESPCTRYDELGMCIARAAERPECARRERKLEYREVEVTHYRAASATARRDVHHRRLQVTIGGSLKLADGTAHPLQVVLSHGDQAYWSPAESRHFDHLTLESISANAAIAFVDQLRAHSNHRRVERASKFAEAARAAENAGRVAEAIDRWTIAMLAGAGSGGASPLFQRLYGLHSGEVDQVLRGAPLAIAYHTPGAALPPPETTELDEAWVRNHVRRDDDGDEAHGFEMMAEAGVDLGFMIAASPLAAAERAHGLTLRARFRRFHLFGSATARTLGGDAGGYSLGMAGIHGEQQDGYFFSWGLQYRQERAPNGERYQSLDIPFWLGIPLGDWLAVQVGISPNALALKDLAGEAAEATHYYSPVFARLILDLLDRFYFELGATHYLGIGLDDPIHIDGILGVRL